MCFGTVKTVCVDDRSTERKRDRVSVRACECVREGDRKRRGRRKGEIDRESGGQRWRRLRTGKSSNALGRASAAMCT